MCEHGDHNISGWATSSPSDCPAEWTHSTGEKRGDTGGGCHQEGKVERRVALEMCRVPSRTLLGIPVEVGVGSPGREEHFPLQGWEAAHWPRGCPGSTQHRGGAFDSDHQNEKQIRPWSQRVNCRRRTVKHSQECGTLQRTVYYRKPKHSDLCLLGPVSTKRGASTEWETRQRLSRASWQCFKRPRDFDNDLL